MYGLVKTAMNYEKLYEEHPDLNQLRLNELSANKQYEKDDAAYKEELKSNVAKGMVKGLGIGGGLGLVPGVITRNPGLATGGGLGGGMLGSLIGGSVAEHRLKQTSPLYKQRDRSLEEAIQRQDDHVNRWMELADPSES